MQVKALGRLALAAIPFAVWAVIVVLFYLDVTGREQSLDRFLIADMASAYNLALDVADDPLAVFEWTLPSANYIFPDLFILLPFAAAGWHFDEAIPFYAAICLFVYTLGGYALAVQILKGVQAATAAALMTSLAGSLLLTGSYPGHLIAAPNFHGSIAILSPAILAVTACSLSQGLSSTRGVVCAIIAASLLGALSFSDRLAAVAITTPLTMSLLACATASSKYRRTALLLAISLGAVSAAAVLADMQWRPVNSGAAVAPSPSEFWPNVLEMLRQADDLRVTLPWIFYGTLSVPILATVAFAIQISSLRKADKPDVKWQLVLGYLTVYYPFVSIVHAASTLEPVLHYRLADLILACLFIPLLLLRLMALVELPKSGIALALAATCIIIVHALKLAPLRNYGEARILPFVKCLDELATTYDLSYGAAEYWDAIPVRPLSRRGLTVISVGPTLAPRNWNQTLRIDTDRPFDFLIHHKNFEADALRDLRPIEVNKTCGDRTVSILKRY